MSKASLDKLFSVFVDPCSTFGAILEARSRLGFVLHSLCIASPTSVFNHIIKVMETSPRSPMFSMILVASASFTLKYVPIQDRQQYLTWASGPFLRHAVSNDPDHLANLSQFIQSGGASMLPCFS